MHHDEINAKHKPNHCDCGPDCKCGCQEGKECTCDKNGCKCDHKRCGCCGGSCLMKLLGVLIIFFAGMGFNEFIHGGCFGRCPAGKPMMMPMGPMKHQMMPKDGNVIIINTDGNVQKEHFCKCHHHKDVKEHHHKKHETMPTHELPPAGNSVQ